MSISTPTAAEIELIRRDKYDGNTGIDLAADIERLASGEPLAYIIGWIPFLGLKIYLESPESTDFRPLIPRPETEWWTEKLIAYLNYKFKDRPFSLLDLCSGSGAIGLAILASFPDAQVTCTDLEPKSKSLIAKNIQENDLDERRATILSGDLFNSVTDSKFDIIATNPPYIPDSQKTVLSKSVMQYEPHIALFAGPDGSDIISKIITDCSTYLLQDGELWMECDITNIAAAEISLTASGAREITIHEDQYGRPRLIVAHFE